MSDALICDDYLEYEINTKILMYALKIDFFFFQFYSYESVFCL